MDTNTNPKPRTLVLCFDGTGGQYGSQNTNVVKLFALLKKNDVEQLTYYQAGLGTWFKPGVVSPILEWGAKIMDIAVAWYLSAHVIDGYTFLMNNYRKGDKICLFGFSRGAYTARALAGFLYKVGLLPGGNESQVSFAYKLYKRTDAEGLKLCAGFKQTYCRHVTLEFIGVWDTVCSVGLLWSRSLPFTSSNNAIKTFRHAMALDEHRTKYRPNYYHRSPPATSNNDAAETGELDSDDIKEVWFAGCHADIGGSAVPNDVEQSLSNITLRWMVREVIASGLGDIFDTSSLARAKMDLEAEPMDSTDALDPINDMMRRYFIWWLIEIFPVPYSFQDTNNIWHTSYVPNFGRGRKIVDVDPHPTMHTTVKKRMESQLKYKPRAQWTPNSEVYVD